MGGVVKWREPLIIAAGAVGGSGTLHENGDASGRLGLYRGDVDPFSSGERPMESQLEAQPLASVHEGREMTLEKFQYANPVPELRTELVDGRLLVREPPRLRQGSVSTNVVIALSRYFDRVLPKGAPRGLLASNDAGVILRRHPDTVRAPDVLYFTTERQPVDLDRYAELAPDLVVEVRSPSDSPGYLQRKVTEWLTFGCQQVWVIDATQRTVTMHEPHRVTHLTATDDLDGGALFPGFTVPIVSLFP